MRKKNINKEICKEIQEKLEILKTLHPGTNEYNDTLEAISKLYKLVDEDDKYNRQYLDVIFKTAGICIDVMAIALPLMFYAKWMEKGFEFEKTGSFTSTTFRGLFQRFKTT